MQRNGLIGTISKNLRGRAVLAAARVSKSDDAGCQHTVRVRTTASEVFVQVSNDQSSIDNDNSKADVGGDNFLDVALNLARQGFRLFPLPSGKKAPPPLGWQKIATTDSALVEQWAAVTPGGFFVQPNIGIATGNGILVVDVDPRNGGNTSLANLTSTHGKLPKTLTVLTAGGGLHFYFRVPTDRAIKNDNRGKLGKGIDLKSDGGYVVAPPSVTDNGTYRWDDPDVTIADAPVWLLDLATKPLEPKSASNSGESSTTDVRMHNITLGQARDMAGYLDPNCGYDTWTQDILWPLYRMGLGAQDGSTINEWVALGDEVSSGALLDPPRTPASYPGFADVKAKMLEAAKQPGYGLKHFLDVVKAAGAALPPNVSDIGDFDPISDDPSTPPLEPPTGLPEIIFRELRSGLYYNPPSPREYALAGYLPKRIASKFSGPGQLGKSMVMVYAAFCQATGQDFCGHACAPGRVVYLSAEDEFEEFERRMHRLLHELYPDALPPDVEPLLAKNLQAVDLVESGTDAFLTNFDNRNGRVALTPLVKHLAALIGTADLVVFDTQSRFHGGPENDNTAGAVFIRALEVVAKKTGAAVVAISHVEKNKDTNGDQYDRGASSLIDNARGAMKLTRLPSELTERLADPVQIEKADCGNIVRLIHSKNSYGPAHKEEYLERRSNGILLPTALMFKGSQGPTPFAPTLVELAAQLMRTIGCGEVSRNQVYEDYQRWCGPAATRDGAVRAFDFAVAAHQLVFSRKYRSAELYGIPNRDLL